MPIVKPMLHGGCGQGWQDGFQVMAAIMIMELVTTVMIVEAEVASSERHPRGQRALNDWRFSIDYCISTQRTKVGGQKPEARRQKTGVRRQ